MEALVILIVPAIAVAVYLISRFQNFGEPRNAEEARAALRQQLAWHEHRLQHAQEKNWDDGMIAQIMEQRNETRGRLARVSAAPASVSPQNPAS